MDINLEKEYSNLLELTGLLKTAVFNLIKSASDKDQYMLEKFWHDIKKYNKEITIKIQDISRIKESKNS